MRRRAHRSSDRDHRLSVSDEASAPTRHAERTRNAPHNTTHAHTHTHTHTHTLLIPTIPRYIKLGQIASCRADLVPEEVIAALARLQDDVPPFSGESARAVLAAELNLSIAPSLSAAAAAAAGVRRFDDVFSRFDEVGEVAVMRCAFCLIHSHVPAERTVPHGSQATGVQTLQNKRCRDLVRSFGEVPLAAASLGQVHRARLADGVDLAELGLAAAAPPSDDKDATSSGGKKDAAAAPRGNGGGFGGGDAREVVIKVQRDNLRTLYDADLDNIRKILTICQKLGLQVGRTATVDEQRAEHLAIIQA